MAVLFRPRHPDQFGAMAGVETKMGWKETVVNEPANKDDKASLVDGRQPRDLTADKLLAHSRLPLAWHEQRAVLGFA